MSPPAPPSPSGYQAKAEASQFVAACGLDAGNARDFIAAGAGAVAFGSSVAGVTARPGLIKELHEQITAPWRPLPPGRAAGPGDPAGRESGGIEHCPARKLAGRQVQQVQERAA